MLFSCEGITKCYNREPVVEDINLELFQGGFVSLLGPSGVGKTTLFNVLSGVDRPEAGRVLLAGEDITGISGRVSYMLQKDLLLHHRTVLDNVILPLVIRGMNKGKAREYAAPFFPRFGLGGYENKYPRELSGGMRQRAALLRTCMPRTFGSHTFGQQNPVILLDEPFSALDALTRITMQNWYQGIAAEMGLSTLFITHDVEEAVSLSDRVYVMKGKPGRITECIDILPPRPRSRDFPISPEFARFKRTILEAIGLEFTGGTTKKIGRISTAPSDRGEPSREWTAVASLTQGLGSGMIHQ
ncbi:nitrate ABC transporter ATP-binding protein [Spirochaetia bacterium]|nr:nitrate ABC transporter ATP-binding protein [Spirochaetia bacterium]